MRLRPEIRWQRDHGPGFLFDSRTGSVFGLNRSAAEVLAALDRCANRQELLEHLGVDDQVRPALSDDIAGFLQLLQDHDLLLL